MCIKQLIPSILAMIISGFFVIIAYIICVSSSFCRYIETTNLFIALWAMFGVCVMIFIFTLIIYLKFEKKNINNINYITIQ